jgi:hypothetical protein
MEKIYKYCETTNDTDKIFTILVPLNTGIGNTIVPYNINDKLVALRNDGTNYWFRPYSNYHAKITINIIGLSINDSTLKSKMSTYLNATETEQSSFYIGNIDTQTFYLSKQIPNYTINGIESNTSFNTYLDSVMVDIGMMHSTNPADTNFLSYNTGTTMPIIQSTNPVAHNFIYLRTSGQNDTDAYIYPPETKNPNDLPNTEINICGLKLEGINQTNNSAVYVDTSQQQNFTFKMGTGIHIENFKSVFIDNIIIENMYGNGITIYNRDYAYINDTVKVNRNVIKNVWGLKYRQYCNNLGIKYDDTGDALRFEGIDSGESNSNYIYNDLSYTKQFGRIGLATCSEHNRNTIADSNYIHGYDRNIHSENNLSGFKIRYNRITGSETGIVFDGNRDYTSNYFCPKANKSDISYNYISNEGIVYHPDLQKIYPPHLFFSPGAHRSNEYYGTEIKNNEFVLDKANAGFQYSSDVAPVIMGNCSPANQLLLATNPRPYSSTLSVNNTPKYHFYSGIRAQKVTCNLFNTIHSNNTGYTIGGVILRSFCPNEITGANTSCGLFFNNSVTLPSCSTNQLTTSSIPIEFKDNILMNCNEINILHPNSSFATNGLYPNYFVNNDSTSITSNINIDHFIKAPILVPYNCNNWYNTPFLFANISAQNPSCANPINSGKIGLTSIGGSGNITYTINPTATQTNPGNFTNLPANTYTITATDANAVSISTVVEIISPLTGNFCACANGDTLVKTPNIILKTAPTASNFIAQYGSVISGKVFYIDSIFTVDTSINFENCSFWFTSSGQILLNGPYTLNLAKCKLQAACDWWQGIVANTPQQKVIVQNNSLIKNADIGIEASNNAIVEISNSFFMDNHTAGLFLKDMTDSNYSGYVIGSRFEAPTVIPSQPNALKLGIALHNIVKMNIGDISNGSKGNTFTKLRLGIYYVGTAPIISNIGIYNNKFHQIKETYYTNAQFPEAYIINNTYNLGYGTAIYAYNFGSPMNHKLNLDVRNASPASSNLAFSQCDRGIVTVQSSLIAENLYLDSVTMGICNFSYAPNVSYSVNNNKLYNTYIGMQFEGGDKDNSEVKSNTIECTLYPYSVATNIPGSNIWPKGISVSCFNSGSTNTFDIKDQNTITIPSYGGVGINVLHGGSGLAIKDNIINLSNNDVNQIVCSGSTILTGIMSSQATGTRIHRNAINANTFIQNNTPTDALLRIDAAGILVDHGQDQAIGCNAISGARFGLMAWSENNTNVNNELLVQGNTVLNTNAGWVLRHIGTEGTLGNVGNLFNDNNNAFPTLSGGPKVFKFCLGSDPFQIFTTSINQLTESLSENMNTQANDCWYLIQNNPGAIVFNNSPNGTDCGLLQITTPWDGNEIPIEEAFAIATNTKVYVEFPTLAHWYDCKRLYDYLTGNPGLLNDYPQLDSFFTVMTNDAIAQIEATDQHLHNLLQSFDIYTPAQREAMLQYIENSNNGINDTEEQNANEREINRIYLQLVRHGIDSLTETDKTFISNLAPQCPYIGGSAVYKARSLNFYLQPGAMYDDMKACNAANVYKQGNTGSNIKTNVVSLISKENEILSRIKPDLENAVLKLNEIVLYPNPTEDFVYLRYNTNQSCRIELFDITGRKLKVVLFTAGYNKTSIALADILPGVYTYKFLVGDTLIKSGKIIKQ